MPVAELDLGLGPRAPGFGLDPFGTPLVAPLPDYGLQLIGKKTGNTSSASVAVTLLAPVAVGEYLVIVSAEGTDTTVIASANITSITDTIQGSANHNAYTSIIEAARTGGSPVYYGEAWCAPCTQAMAVGDTITATFGAASNDHVLLVFKLTGVDSSNGPGGIPGIDTVTSATFGAVTSTTLSTGAQGVQNAWVVSITMTGDNDQPNGGNAIIESSGNFNVVADVSNNDGVGNVSRRLTVHNKRSWNSSASQTALVSWLNGGTRNGVQLLFTIKSSLIVAPQIATAPIVNCGPRVGALATSTNGIWQNNPTGYAKQWWRYDDASLTNPVSIPGATGDTYRLTSADLGKYVQCVVTATNVGGSNIGGSNLIGGSFAHVDTAGVVTAPGVGIADFDHTVFRLIATGRDSDHQTRQIPITDHVPAGDSIFFFYGYSVNTNWTAGRTDPQGNPYSANKIYDGTYAGLDLWSTLNVQFPLVAGTLLFEQAGGTPAIHPSDSIEYAIFAVTPPQDKILAFDSSAVGDTTFDTNHATASMVAAGSDELLFGHICMGGHNPPNWSPGAGWAELVDQGDAIDPNVSIAVQFKRVNAPGNYSSTGTSVGTTNSSQLIAGFMITSNNATGSLQDPLNYAQSPGPFGPGLMPWVKTDMSVPLGQTFWSDPTGGLLDDLDPLRARSSPVPFGPGDLTIEQADLTTNTWPDPPASTSVSTTAGMVIDMTQDIAATDSDPIDAGQGIATTASDPVEATQGVATTAADPIDATQGIAQTGSGPVEELQGIAGTGVLPLDELAGVGATGVLPLDELQAIAQTGSDPVDEAQGIAATSSDPVDETQGIAQTGSLALEELQGIATTAVEILEALGGVATSSSDPVEALQALVATGVLPLTALQGIAATSGTLPLDETGTVTSPVSQTAALVIESLAPAATTAAAIVDALAGIAAQGAEPVESLQALAPVALVPLEAAKQVAQAVVVIPVESSLGVSAIVVLPVDEAGFQITLAFTFGKPVRGWIIGPPGSGWETGAITDGWEPGPPQR